MTRNAVPPLVPIRRQIATALHGLRPLHSRTERIDTRQRHSVARQKTKSPESLRNIRAFGGAPWDLQGTLRNSRMLKCGFITALGPIEVALREPRELRIDNRYLHDQWPR
jgi:hypothetical protein